MFRLSFYEVMSESQIKHVNTALKVKVSYGIMFVDEIESGFIQFLKVRFPVPFIP